MLSSKERKAVAAILAIGFIYSLIVRYTSFCIPCFFRSVTGFRCPGCGITHLFMCLMELNFYGAFRSNAFLFVTFPILAVIILLNRMRPNASFIKGVSVIYLILLLIWGVVRNILNI